MIQRYVNISFVLIGILTWVILSALIGVIFDWVNSDWNLPLIGARFAISDLMGLVVGIATAVILRRNEKVNRLAVEIGNELKKVTWPTWPETRTATVVVIVVSVVVAGILGVFDAMWSWVTHFVYEPEAAAQISFFSVVGLVAIVGGTVLLFYYASRD